MKKILLINPAFNIIKKNYDSSISVGLLSIATYLDRAGASVQIIDGIRQRNCLDLIKEKAGDFDYAGVSVMTMQAGNALKISKIIKEINPNCKIIWGGVHPTFFPEQTASNPLVDIVCVGEGEYTALEILQGKSLNEIKGIVYKDQNRGVKINPPRELCDPKKMPLFNWDLMPSEILNNLHLIPSLTSRGCPHRCTFCVNAILKNYWRPRAVEQVIKDLEIILNRTYFKNKKLRFWDENFFVDIGRAKKIIDEMLFRNLIIPWETTVRANYLKAGMVDDEFLDKMKKTGCYLLSFGAESGCPRILKKIKKDINPEDVLNSAKMALKHDIIPQYSFMVGLPDETRSEMMFTLNLIDDLVKLSPKIQILGPQAFRPYPGSELYDECLTSGWREPKNLEEWAQLAENELNYLAVKNFPWIKRKDKNFVESIEAYVRFGAQGFQSALGSTVTSNKFLKILFIAACKLRWKLRFFKWPFEYKLAKKYIAVSGGN